MKSNVIPSRVQMESVLLQQLVAEVKETIAAGVDVNESENSTSFKAINFWNLQRKGRYANVSTKRKKSTSLSVTHVSF